MNRSLAHGKSVRITDLPIPDARFFFEYYYNFRSEVKNIDKGPKVCGFMTYWLISAKRHKDSYGDRFGMMLFSIPTCFEARLMLLDDYPGLRKGD